MKLSTQTTRGTTKWAYGDAWERHPIVAGVPWVDAESGSRVAVADLRDGVPDFMLDAEIIYTDSPWNAGNVNSFITKAGGLVERVRDFADFYTALFREIGRINPRVCYLEIGKQYLDVWRAEMVKQFPVVEVWPIFYYRKHGAFLVRGGDDLAPAQYTGMDDEFVPRVAVEAEGPGVVGDLCTGRGGTLIAAHLFGRPFVGTELNPRRLAVAIERAAHLGVDYRRDAT